MENIQFQQTKTRKQTKNRSEFQLHIQLVAKFSPENCHVNSLQFRLSLISQMNYLFDQLILNMAKRHQGSHAGMGGLGFEHWYKHSFIRFSHQISTFMILTTPFLETFLFRKKHPEIPFSSMFFFTSNLK